MTNRASIEGKHFYTPSLLTFLDENSEAVQNVISKLKN